MSDLPHHPIRMSDLTNRADTSFSLMPDAATRSAVAQALGIEKVKKLTFTGEIAPIGQTDWLLTAKLGATIVQNCVISLVPVTTRIDDDITRTYKKDVPEVSSVEIEMDADDTVEELPKNIDLGEIMVEALSLSLPTYPRAPGIALGEAIYSQSDTAPMSDEAARPFAGLGSLREALENKDDDG